MAVVEGEADYADFIRKMNEQVKHYKQEVLPKAKKRTAASSPATVENPERGRNLVTAGRSPMARGRAVMLQNQATVATVRINRVEKVRAMPR